MQIVSLRTSQYTSPGLCENASTHRHCQNDSFLLPFIGYIHIEVVKILIDFPKSLFSKLVFFAVKRFEILVFPLAENEITSNDANVHNSYLSFLFYCLCGHQTNYSIVLTAKFPFGSS